MLAFPSLHSPSNANEPDIAKADEFLETLFLQQKCCLCCCYSLHCLVYWNSGNVKWMMKFIWILVGAMGALVKSLSNKETLWFFRKDQLKPICAFGIWMFLKKVRWSEAKSCIVYYLFLEVYGSVWIIVIKKWQELHIFHYYVSLLRNTLWLFGWFKKKAKQYFSYCECRVGAYSAGLMRYNFCLD